VGDSSWVVDTDVTYKLSAVDRTIKHNLQINNRYNRALYSDVGYPSIKYNIVNDRLTPSKLGVEVIT